MRELTALDPVVNVFAAYRARLTQLDPRWLAGEVWGYEVDGRLVSACHAAANLVPVQATPEAITAFAERAVSQTRRCATIVGPSSAVEPLWELLEPHWGPARRGGCGQPHMETPAPPGTTPAPRERRRGPAPGGAPLPAAPRV